MPRFLCFSALVVVLQATPFPNQLPVDDLAPVLHKEATEVQRAWDRYPDNPCVLYQVAALYSKAGHKPEALAALRVMLDKHAGLDPRVGDGFENLASDREFLALKREIRHEYPPALNARPAFAIAEADLLSEGIAWSAKQKRFYLGSVKRKIISVDEKGNARIFVPPAVPASEWLWGCGSTKAEETCGQCQNSLSRNPAWCGASSAIASVMASCSRSIPYRLRALTW